MCTTTGESCFRLSSHVFFSGCVVDLFGMCDWAVPGLDGACLCLVCGIGCCRRCIYTSRLKWRLKSRCSSFVMPSDTVGIEAKSAGGWAGSLPAVLRLWCVLQCDAGHVWVAASGR